MRAAIEEAGRLVVWVMLAGLVVAFYGWRATSAAPDAPLRVPAVMSPAGGAANPFDAAVWEAGS